ncbi:LA_2272/LA_2273 family lipoprotein [Leptospira mayottensis]|uniref:LA_2272/LA_2273 family lipoprotein n=1 Tax=Leptospira mayottensis TaxID=1137606 RepID=UPI0002BEDC6B|nr:hypothetical protein DQM68_12850 [Leptospira mayottensis]AZQ02124.1 hypothetical protein LEP1GSC190_08870 [Leptospira mayottensis 200901116]TGN10142.1 hypothetical protein EHR03_07585 [Leptospira mayottensis]
MSERNNFFFAACRLPLRNYFFTNLLCSSFRNNIDNRLDQSLTYSLSETMKNKFTFTPFVLFFSSWIFASNCGFALTPRITVKIPPQTQTEIFRLNLLLGEVRELYGINLGGMNYAHSLIGTQVGIINISEESIGILFGLLNNSGSYGTLKIGFLNTNFFLDRGMPPYENEGKEKIVDDLALSIGAVNLMSGRFNLGLFNWGAGLNVGIVNTNEGRSVNFGIVNIGTKLEVYPKEKPAISFGIVNTGTNRNELQIGVLNFCEKGLLPFMIGINYCLKTVSQTTEVKTETIEPQPVETKVDVKVAPGEISSK